MTTIPVLWLPPGEQWDQEQFRDLLGGELAPPGYRFEHHQERLPDVDGAVVVVAGRYHDALDLVREAIAPLSWVLLVVTGDEASTFPWQEVEHPNIRWWVMTPRSDVHAELEARFVGSGWTPHLRANLDAVGKVPRTRGWSFAGQVNHDRRREAADVLARSSGGVFLESPGFTQGLPHDAYARLLAETRVVPCPSGPHTPDSFRLYEALEAGCVPLLDNRAPDHDAAGYWPMVFPELPPVEFVDDWADADKLIEASLVDWPQRANAVQAWWLRHRARMSDWLADDLRSLGRVPARRVDDDITVIVPTSPIPSHPSTAILAETIDTVRLHLPGARIVVAFDGVRDEQEAMAPAYAEYVQRALRLCREWGNTVAVVADGHVHQVGVTRLALEQVATPLVLFVEHDCPVTPDCPIDWDACAEAVLSGAVNLIRFHHESHVLDDHRHLMIGDGPVDTAGAPLWPTVQWSQRPHLASAAYYRQVLARWFPPTARTMIEDRMHGVVQDDWELGGRTGWALHRLAIYCPEGNIKRSYTTDGRRGAPKFEMEFE